ncbi:transposase [Nitrincola sp. A-D6]|uniref:REP-associated tyrosine transposase n=1 Tax=Nitrincola sp. A-D6 TaxID=1545442 RepID=UPI00051FEC46|nr:transposase [Nitrincola sp. A-D6]KGK40950.1 transposase [Nitrincola sp. A-D6]
MYHSHRLRHGRFSASGQIYLITTVCCNRRPIFLNFDHARIALQALRQTAASTDTLSYVIMPDHVHWLLQLKEGADLSAAVRFFKASATRGIHSQGSEMGPVLQKGFYDRQLRKEEDLVAMARYVVANPIRAGLVRSVREYSFWDAIWL